MAKIPFSAMNITLAKMIAANAPKGVSSLIEPFGDGGAYALFLAKKKPKSHVLNIVNEVVFAAMSFVQTMTGAQMSAMKKRDWVGSPEAFDAASAISAVDGPDAFYRFFYLKKFGMKADKKDPDSEVLFNPFGLGVDNKVHLYGLPLMRVALKGVTLINEDPMTVMNGSGFLVLVPMLPDHVEAVKSRLSAISGDYIFLQKLKDKLDIIQMVKDMPDRYVSSIDAASIMMATMSIVTNYENGLPLIPEEVIELVA